MWAMWPTHFTSSSRAACGWNSPRIKKKHAMSCKQRWQASVVTSSHGAFVGYVQHADSSACRTFEYGPGGFVGDFDFVLQSPRSFRAVAGSHGCCLLVCSQQAYVHLLEKYPAALGVLQAVMLRNACINKRHALDHMASEAVTNTE